MSRTKRNIQWNKYWGCSKEKLGRRMKDFEGEPYYLYLERAYLLHGSDAKNITCNSGEYYNVAHRMGRRIERDQLRPHKVLDENFEFDDSRYRRKYKGIWWDIF